MEHLEEFATLKAMGASSSYINRLVLSQALFCGLVGSCIGLLATLPAVQLARNFIPWVDTPFWLPFGMIGVGLLMCALALLYPSEKFCGLIRQGCFVRDEQIILEQVNVSFGRGAARINALSDVTLTLAPDGLTLVMGPSGSGKTTLLSVLGCLLEPDAGAISLLGNQIKALTQAELGRLRNRYIGYVFQAFRLFHSLTALENVMLTLELAGESRRATRTRASEALAQVGLSNKLGLKPDELSGGEKQRVAIARALIKNPPILLADEPTASLDGASGLQIAEMLQQVAERDRRIVVVVSHDPRLMTFAKRIIQIEDGRLLSDRWQEEKPA